MPPGMVVSRDVDKLDAMPDAAMQKADAAYLTRHGLDKLFGELLQHMVEHKPQDPIQFMIDALEFNIEYAAQDPSTGLPQHRLNKLSDVFRVLDKEALGKVSFANLQTFAAKHGGATLNNSELSSIFTDFQPGEDNMITPHEFLVYFSKVSRTLSNSAFDTLVKDLMA